MNIKIYDIQTASGRLYFCTLPFLSNEELKEFNTIGYTGKNSKGERTNFQNYLNSLGKGQFEVKQTKFDDGSFSEKFTVVRVTD